MRSLDLVADDLASLAYELFEAETDDPGGVQETKRRLAYWIEGFRDENQPDIDSMYLLYRGTTTAVLIEAILWSVGLALA
jgi:hypothetical protein